MSLVNKILKSAADAASLKITSASGGRLQATEITSKIAQLEKDSAFLKHQMFDNVVAKYENFESIIMDAQVMSDKVNALTCEIQDTRAVIQFEIQQELNTSTAEFSDLQTQLCEVTEVTKVVNTLMQIERHLSSLPQTYTRGSHTNSALSLVDIMKLNESLRRESYSDTDVNGLKAIKTEISVRREEFLYASEETLKKQITRNITTTKSGQLSKAQFVISKDECAIADVMQGLAYFGHFNKQMSGLADDLMKFLFTPLINDSNFEVCVIDDIDNFDDTTIEVVNADVDASTDSVDCPTLQQVVSNLQKIFTALHDSFLHIVVKETVREHSDITDDIADDLADDITDSDTTPSRSLMSIVGSFCSSEFINNLISVPLSNSIPLNHNELVAVDEMEHLLKEFQNLLISTQFLKQTDNLLLDFVLNIDILFVNKKSSTIIKQAQKLMKRVLHDQTPVKPDAHYGQTVGFEAGTDVKSDEKSEVKTDGMTRPRGNVFALPECHISVCIEDLITLAYTTMQEATEQSTSTCATKLFYSVKNIFELFCSVVPTYHRQSLTSLPQIAAIHYNNCMFISHHLMTMGFQFSSRLLPPLNDPEVCTFIDIVHKIRRIGSESFLAQINSQKAQLLQFITDANGFLNASEPENLHRIDRAVKQCLYQLNHLQHVWQPVLPSNVYSKAIGTLINAVMTEMISNVVTLEDISTDDAVQLHILLKRLKSSAANLFRSDSTTTTAPTTATDADLQKNAKKTAAVSELLIVLDGGLQEVSDRWSDGKGPLADNFTASQVKQLVRALFQNTDRRAAVLAKIL